MSVKSFSGSLRQTDKQTHIQPRQQHPQHTQIQRQQFQQRAEVQSNTVQCELFSIFNKLQTQCSDNFHC